MSGDSCRHVLGKNGGCGRPHKVAKNEHFGLAFDVLCKFIGMEANRYNLCFTISGINPWYPMTPMFARVYHSDGGRSDIFSIGADWTKSTASSSWNLSMI